MKSKTVWPEAGSAGEVVSAESYRVFKIQSVWAEPEKEDAHLRWNSYYDHAFRDKKSGKLFQKAFPDLCNDPSRVTWGNGYGADREHKESFAFRELEAAQRLVKQLRKSAEWASDYEGNEAWRVVNRGRPIKFRIVEINMAKTVTVSPS